MATEVLTSEVGLMKEQLWKLSSRVLLLEGFIKQQFGNVFWQFCEDQVKGGGESSTEEEEGDNNISISIPSSKPLSLPPMIPMNIPPNNKKTAMSVTTVNNNKKPIPPPPPLSHMRGGGGYHHPPPKGRNFLPKSLSNSNKTNNPRLPPSITITPTHHHPRGNNNGVGMSILKEKVMMEGNLNLISNNHHHHQYHEETTKGTKQQQRKSPALIGGSRGGNNLRLSTGSTSSIPSVSSQQRMQHYQAQEDYIDYYHGESEESEDDPELYGDGGFLPSELVSATLSTPDEDGDGDGEGDMMEDNNTSLAQAKRMRISPMNDVPPHSMSIPTSSSSSTSSFLNGSGNNGNGNNGQRQMRPNPCHARCQNRCHDIWTDGDRMGVFQTYWSLPTDDERREFVASRIERVDMATKRTEFSNFRTCTFKYYLPHPENPWVQVCKNFFLATIDEKRSYIEKIAQSVKGEAAEKLSTKNIPFRRRNQMQRSMEENYSVWMQQQGNIAADLSMGDGDDHDPESQGYLEGDGDGEQEQDQDHNQSDEGDQGHDGMGMEIMEEGVKVEDQEEDC